MPKNKEYTDPIAESFYTLSSIKRGSLRSDHEIQALKFLFDKYNCRTVTEESKMSGLTRPTVYNQIKSGEAASVKLGNQTFVIQFT